MCAQKPLSCKDKLKNGFVKFEGLKVPDTTHTWWDESIGLEECRVKCLNSCSCMAYSNSDIRGEGSGCVMWFGDLIDMKQLQTGKQDLYIRMAASELGMHCHFLSSLFNHDYEKSSKIALILDFFLMDPTRKILYLGTRKICQQWLLLPVLLFVAFCN